MIRFKEILYFFGTKKLYLFVSLLTILQASAIAQNNVEKLRINPEAAIGGEASKFIEEVSFIPMETTKQSEFSDILQLEMNDKYYIILDKGASAILIFTRQGKFYKRINTGKVIYQFTYDKERNVIEFQTYPDTYVYDLDGNLIKKTINKSIPHGLLGVSKMELDKNHTAYYNTSVKTTKDSLIYELLVYAQEGIANHFFPFSKNYKMDEFDDFGFKNFILNYDGENSSIYYTHNYDYNVYRLTPTAVFPVYQFIFPIQYSLPDDFYKLTEKGTRMQFFQENKKIIPRIFSFYKNGDLLYFHTGQSPYLYNVKTKHLINIDKIISDSSSNYLPISPAELNEGTLNLLNFDGKYFYASCPPQTLFNQMKATKNRKKSYSDKLVNFFNNKKNEMGNPVLIQIRFKRNI